MTGLAGNGRNVYSGYNPLCDTLRAKYADRVRRAANGAPGNTAPSRRQTTSASADRQSGAHRPAASQPARERSAGQTVRDTSNSAHRSEPYRGTVQRERTSARASGMQYASDRYDAAYRQGGSADISTVRRRSGRYVAPKAKAEKQGFLVSAAQHIRETMDNSRREAKRQRSAEIKLTKKPFPKGAVVSALICTVMLLVVLFSYAQVYEMNRTISDLKSESVSLSDEVEKLQVELELKDDIRTIEQIATEEIGMVKSDRVDTRYISVSGGEHIDVIESTDDQTENVNMFTTLLSAIGENFEKILDRIE